MCRARLKRPPVRCLRVDFVFCRMFCRNMFRKLYERKWLKNERNGSFQKKPKYSVKRTTKVLMS